jgi:LysR family glycine cleavage system transcriptional activator
MLSDSAMLMEAAAAGEGVALVRGLIARGALQSGRLIRPFDIAIEDSYSYHLLWPPNTQISSLGTAFLEWLRQKSGPAAATSRDVEPSDTKRSGKSRARRRAGTARSE